MMDIIGMRSIPMFKVVRSFFWSSCPCYWWSRGGPCLVVTGWWSSRDIKSVEFCMLVAFLFQLAVFPFNWINKVMEEVSDKVGRMMNVEASHDQTAQSGPSRGWGNNRRNDKKYPWWMLKRLIKEKGGDPPFKGISTVIWTHKTTPSRECIRPRTRSYVLMSSFGCSWITQGSTSLTQPGGSGAGIIYMG
jgi:hypothetical protein